MKLMAVMAHPDDAEIWCGGTLILHADKGDEVLICVLSYTKDTPRGVEALEGAKNIGCKIEMLGLMDTAIRDTDDNVKRLWQSIDHFRPDIIITHWHDDFHPDHEATFRLISRALVYDYFVNPIDNIHDAPRVFCCDTYGSRGLRGTFKPDAYVDVSQIWTKKNAAIEVYKSQPYRYYLEMIDKQCADHGIAAGMKRAEGFIYLPMFGRANDGQLGG